MSEKTYTEKEVSAMLQNIMLTERFAAWFSISMQRSKAAGDPKAMIEAADLMYAAVMAPKSAAQEPEAEQDSEKAGE